MRTGWGWGFHLRVSTSLSSTITQISFSFYPLTRHSIISLRTYLQRLQEDFLFPSLQHLCKFIPMRNRFHCGLVFEESLRWVACHLIVQWRLSEDWVSQADVFFLNWNLDPINRNCKHRKHASLAANIMALIAGNQCFLEREWSCWVKHRALFVSPETLS